MVPSKEDAGEQEDTAGVQVSDRLEGRSSGHQGVIPEGVHDEREQEEQREGEEEHAEDVPEGDDHGVGLGGVVEGRELVVSHRVVEFLGFCWRGSRVAFFNDAGRKFFAAVRSETKSAKTGALSLCVDRRASPKCLSHAL